MNVSKNLMTLRKRYGYSQEELANKLDVSRQSVSKWESGQSIPELDRLIEITKIFDITLDELVQGEDVKMMSTENTECKQSMKEAIHESLGYEYQSKWSIGKIPLLHINIGHGVRVAKGIFAIGNIAFGVFALGGMSLGVFTIAAIGLGMITLGAISIGYLAVGALAIGINAIGAVAIAKDIAVGAIAKAEIAIGKSVSGNQTMIISERTTVIEIKNFISQYTSSNSLIRNILWFFLS